MREKVREREKEGYGMCVCVRDGSNAPTDWPTADDHSACLWREKEREREKKGWAVMVGVCV